ncbi:MAG TPA: HAD hydrolase-like protein, partial [Dehalococcoidia bacterium]|nr:HAD hydrolase-like protein [Dehalococcoidia bacterium]
MQRMRAIVFDLDGTLVDTFALSLRGTQHVLRRFVSRPVPDAEVIPLYGIPLRDIMARLADLPTGQA